MELVIFEPDMQEAVFAFLQSCIPKTGRSFEPRGRHAPLTRISDSYGGLARDSGVCGTCRGMSWVR
ncbi:hypothetical protein ANACOL_01356 [Anaerotruncus colihominis DSM 17241]|uniref:Uncharacterized protein n=1 Tax=Anaerotruncus colihominis DSM 17241 TaxID=445972 RepID=B0P9A9_9FIRM|nr:hypothetical protein ANACOL_01356 [Anaerotruncus colihominis DSM 17241]